jgi:excisionase family DNA binding protein
MLPHDEYLTLEQAAALTGLRKRELRAMVRSGRLPAIRRERCWYVQRTDVVAWREAATMKKARATNQHDQATNVPVQRGAEREELLLVLHMLQEKDAQLATLQEERVRLAGQVGFLQAQLAERDVRLQLLEATNEPPQLPALTEGARAQGRAEESTGIWRRLLHPRASIG